MVAATHHFCLVLYQSYHLAKQNRRIIRRQCRKCQVSSVSIPTEQNHVVTRLFLFHLIKSYCWFVGVEMKCAGGQVGSSRTKVSRTQTAGPMAGWVLRTTNPHPTLLILITWLFCCYFIHIMSQKRREICRVTLCLLFGWNCLFWAKGGRLFEPPDKEVPRRRCCCRFLFIFLMFFLVFFSSRSWALKTRAFKSRWVRKLGLLFAPKVQRSLDPALEATS